ncbi:MAG TPA: hypothetical protein VI854_04965 [Acidimicrobiia bacterium]|nr:hypothetical protein [Acidimicrobiia bacterium]
MDWHLRLEQVPPSEAAELLAGIARELQDGVLEVGGTRMRVSGPVDMSIDVDASPTSAHAVITVRGQRPDGGSRLLREELAHPGG